MHVPAFHLRTYGPSTGLDRHDHAQWVLPICGELEFELSGTVGRLGGTHGAFVAADERHDQLALADNQWLIIDCPAGLMDDQTHEALCRQRWLALPAQIRRQVNAVRSTHDAAALWPMLLAHFAPEAKHARLHALCASINADPGAPWPVERMAHALGASISRTHALFRAYFDCSPQAWLSATRLRHARHAMQTTQRPLVDIAHSLGYSEQSALTRAFRREHGVSPAAWRRLNQ
ncbi:AraC-like DNA-binding protein [Luteibacter sp. Sphag1AF]|uniref:helix-turn-helix transcriptional regulator n=1 Tax=Luteibacter sp. Sphag1AF TaxID=2587031 RepID=UPI00162093AA|nr:AraC family transcriptional regulator [Luteibacter sp. Sphag1AF]MBB3228234.1 AraC-like DNA-binding protein [Luteibacter sp. Sphag1AF]